MKNPTRKTYAKRDSFSVWKKHLGNAAQVTKSLQRSMQKGWSNPMPHRLPEQLSSKIVPVTESGCWLWTAGVSEKGYARVYWQGTTGYAHRIIYKLLRGRIPAKLTLDHVCRVRCCVNPDHLEVVTLRANILRGRSFSAVNSKKSHCPQGHPYNKANTCNYRGQRRCRTCNNIRRQQYRKGAL